MLYEVITVCELLQCGYKDLVCVDLPGKTDNSLYLSDKKRLKYVDNDKLVSFLQNNFRLIQMVIHLGACSDTTETKQQVFEELNINYSKTLWNFCAQFGLPLIYASSGATYGDGLAGYSDNHACVKSYKPLNLYGWSKQVFDEWVLDQQNSPFYWVGLKFFNVYGPNEHHKGAMSSVVLKAFNQIKREGYVTLFKSHNPDRITSYNVCYTKLLRERWCTTNQCSKGFKTHCLIFRYSSRKSCRLFSTKD